MFDKLNDSRRWNKIILLLPVLALLAMTACSSSGQKKSASSYQPISWTQSAEDILMRQVAEHELERGYSRYLPDELVAAADIYGIDWEGEQGTAYASIQAGEFVALKGKAYAMSYEAGEVIIRFQFDGQYPKLEELEWSRDGEEHEKWMEDNYPEEYLEDYRESQKADQNGEDETDQKISETVKELMGVPVESEDLLEIDLDKESYEIIRIIEGYDENGEYQFDFTTIDKGKLNELSETTR